MSWLRWTAAILIIGWLGHYPLAMLVPRLVMEGLYYKAAEFTGYNQLNVNLRPDETSRSVVARCQEQLYGSCVYGLEVGPVVVSAAVPER